MRPRILLACVFFGACAKAVPPPAPSSVLLITVDTLRADRVGAYGDSKARTPTIDALAKSGVTFLRAFTPAPITLPAHVSLMTGLAPPQHGVRGNGSFVLGPAPPTLAEAFSKAGRKTAAFIGGFPLSRRFGLARGFDVYDDTMSKSAGVNYDFAERRADAVVDSALAWLQSNPLPAFVWVHVFDPHAPYDPPTAFRTDDPYRDEIAAVDSAIARLITAWDQRPGQNAVVFTSDHGEAFGEHGEWSHSLFVYDTTLHVPLIIRAPGFSGGLKTRANVGLVDVAATLTDVAGLEPLPGRSLASALNEGAADRPLYAETLSPRLDFGWSELRSLRDGGFKWIRAPRPELYSIDRDAGEAENIAATDLPRARAIDAALTTALSAMGEKSATQAVDRETIERLRSLGYVQGGFQKGTGADPKDKVAVARKIAESNGPFANWDDAIKEYRALVALDPQNPLLNLRLADALLRSSKAADSLPYFARVVKSAPLSADPYVGFATALAQLGRLREAKDVLETGLGADPRSGQIHYNLGEIARIEGRSDDARKAYEAAQRDPVTEARARARLAELK